MLTLYTCALLGIRNKTNINRIYATHLEFELTLLKTGEVVSVYGRVITTWLETFDPDVDYIER